jgi:hypothetical protein
MRRLLCLLPLAALLVLPPAVPAKGEIDSLTLCGAGRCHGVPGDGARRGLEDGATSAPAPEHAEPFLELRIAVRPQAGKHVPGFSLRYLPGAGLLRGEDEFGPVWTQPAPALAAALKRAARGLPRKPPALLGPLRAAPARARVVEVVQPPADADAGDGGELPWPLFAGGAAALALGLAAITTRRIRRRRASGPLTG